MRHDERNARWGLAVAAALFCGSCTAPGTVQASEIAPLVKKLCERHDAYVRADGGLSEQDRATFLRSSEILRSVLAEAAKK